MPRLIWPFWVALILAGSACSQKDSKHYETQMLVLGTLVDVSIWGADRDRAAIAATLVEQRLRTLQHDLHAWLPGPLLRINEAIAAGQSASVTPELARLISQGTVLSEQSDGLFNPAIGALIGLWGFHSDTPPQGPPPGASAIQRLLAATPAMGDIHIDAGILSSDNRSVQLDFGGFAKGYAVDEAIGILKKQGIGSAIINAGGDLRAIGRHGDRPWRIGIRDPNGTGVMASIETKGDESVFTSGNYERFFDYQGQRYHHIIDPRTGYPAGGSASVTIVSQSAQLADAAATALFVAGPMDWGRIARQMGVKMAMLIDTGGKVYMTQGMARRIRFEVKPEPRATILPP